MANKNPVRCVEGDQAVHHDLSVTRKKLRAALQSIKNLKTEIEEKNRVLQQKNQLLQNSLDQIALMIEERKSTNEEIERLSLLYHTNVDNIVDLLSSLIDSKCRYHRGHSRKVAEISTFIAKELTSDSKEIRAIEIAALLHELGKLTIPDHLAMKHPEDCTTQEVNLLIQHPLRGAACLENFKGFEQVAGIIRHMHENVDGTGIPDGLKGEAIPLGSRIIAAANMFDNLAYRSKEDFSGSDFETIEEQAGLRLDPQMIYYLHKYAHAHPVNENDRKKEIRIYELEPGMTLAAGIFTKGGAKLLPMNTVLTEESIAKILHYNTIDPLEEIIFIKK